MTRATVKVRDAEFFNAGFILQDFAKMKIGDGDVAQFAAIWRPGSGEQRWATNLDDEAFKAKDSGFFEAGLRLQAFDVESGQFSGVWRAGTGEQRWASGLDHDEFKQRDATFFDQGLRLEQIVVDGGAFGGVWRPGAGEQRWASSMDVDAFKAKDTQFFDKGLRLTDVAVSGAGFAGSGFAITAVWRPGNGEQRWASRSTDDKQELVDLDAEFTAKGLRMEIIAVHR